VPDGIVFNVFHGNSGLPRYITLMPNDKNTAAKRIGRYAKVTTTVGGLAAKVAGERFLGLKIDRADHADALKAALGNLRGPLVKIAQLLSSIPEALPPEYARELQQLQSNAPPMGWPFVKRRMAAELGPEWQDKFRDFPRDATAAASLGQVHRAVTSDGATVACKLQYPDMESAVDADLNQLKLVLGLFEAYDKAIQTSAIRTEIAERLKEELDYAREAQNTKLYAEILKNEKAVQVPQVIDKLCGPRLLTTTWLDGKPIMSFKDAPQEVRDELAMNLFRAWYIPLYRFGIIHGDPHFGNYTVREDHTINLLDFGCIRVFPPRFIKGIIDLYHALMNDDRALAVSAYEAWGFKNLSNELIDTLNVWAGFLYAAVMDDKKRPINYQQGGEAKGKVYGRDTAARVHAELRKHGGVSVPREFVFMDRAALGLGSVFIHLQSKVNWHRLFNELIAGFDLATLEKNQKAVLKKAGLA
jgi:predicted unusual protein kinase regulating ubiquinone biosynthesis (AarF/ABC1/UbiB family)